MAATQRDNSQAAGRHWAVPVPGKLTADGPIVSEQVLPAGGDYLETPAIDVLTSRVVYLQLTVTFGAAGGIVSLVPELSSERNTNFGDWYPIGVTDGTISDTDLDTSLSTVNNGYAHNNFGSLTFRPLEIRTAAADGTEVLKMTIPVDVTGGRWVRFRVAEAGVVGTPSTVSMSFSRSA